MTNTEQFEIKRIYLKDISFECPNGAETFMNPWSPGVTVDVDVNEDKLAEDIFEVALTLTISVENAGETAFMLEIFQAGIFGCSGFAPEKLHRVLYTYCPNILFPYAREAIDSVVTKGSFPALMIEPVNFDALYTSHLDAERT